MVDELEGKMVGGRYRVRHLLGVGGSASVYEGEDTTFGRIVALKILHENVGPKSVAAKRLVREARASGAVGHPNVCQISEIGTLEETGSPFVVMERLIGETLRDRITNAGRLPFEDIVDIMMQVLSGLGAAHDRGIIHRDVKPENIFLSHRAGCPALVKILDFGLVSNDALAKEELTAVGSVVGTPYYIAPEHIRGVRDFDPRVDLYACGVVLYEATSGRRPYTASSHAELFREILAGAAPPVTDIRRDTPPELARAITKAMSRTPSDRYTDAGAFQKALADIPVGPPTASSLASFKSGERQNMPEEPRSRPRFQTGSTTKAPGTNLGSGSGSGSGGLGSRDPETTRIEGGMKPPLPPLPPLPPIPSPPASMQPASKLPSSSEGPTMRFEDGKDPASVDDLNPTSPNAPVDGETIEIEFAKSEEWESATEWDQPTIKQPVPSPRAPRKK